MISLKYTQTKRNTNKMYPHLRRMRIFWDAKCSPFCYSAAMNHRPATAPHRGDKTGLCFTLESQTDDFAY